MTEGRPFVVAIVQARVGSVRLPEKVVAEVLGQPLICHLIDRLRRASLVDEVVLAIPESEPNDRLEELGESAGITVFRGSENDVLDRYYRAALEARAGIVVRVTGDCPLVDPGLVDEVVGHLMDEALDYANTGETFPDGFDVEACTMEALHTAWVDASERADREHVTPYLRTSERFRVHTIDSPTDLHGERVTVDEPEDLVVVNGVFEAFGHNRFTFDDVVALMGSRPDLFEANRRIVRNDGAATNSGQKLWQRAKRVIPGGNMLLSKRSEIHLPGRWPTYFSRASGCTVWDLDGFPYTDVGLMGVGTNILGYGHPKVDEAVRRVVNTGNLTTLNCPEEVYLAERLVDLHPWADMARFTRGGGEACAVAARLARAASGRDVIAICGYHGWHDWYLATNLSDSTALDAHLLPGLEPAGVPRGLLGSIVTFEYNDAHSLERLLALGNIGAVFMEVERSTPPAPQFLERVRDLTKRHNVVLVFDECTSGFRKNLGGLHLTYGVEPDVAVFGKTLGNGYAINAVVGRESVMDQAQDTFISSTFWTERIGPAAALASLTSMEVEDGPNRIDSIGRSVRDAWASIAHTAGVDIDIAGLPALSTFSVRDRDAPVVKTFITQELLKRGYLGGPMLYVSIAHDEGVLERYLHALSEVFERIAQTDSDEELRDLIAGEVCDTGFKRMT